MSECSCANGTLCEFCNSLDGSEIEIFRLRRRVDDLEIYRGELRSIQGDRGGCSCHISPPCSYCTADIRAYEIAFDIIKAEMAEEAKLAKQVVPEPFGMLFAESVYNPTSSPVVRWGMGEREEAR